MTRPARARRYPASWAFGLKRVRGPHMIDAPAPSPNMYLSVLIIVEAACKLRFAHYTPPSQCKPRPPLGCVKILHTLGGRFGDELHLLLATAQQN